MKDRDQKVIESASFYSNNILGIDFKQAEFVYRSIKPFFKGRKGLELGPASGYMTKELVNDFEYLEVVEGSQELINKIPDYPNVLKVCSMFENYNPSQKFDTIIMSHVLEHIENPIELLVSIKNWLEKDGVLIVSVPNAKSIHRLVAVEMGLLKSEFDLNERDVQLGHYRVYDLEELESNMEEAGYKVDSKGGSFLKPISNGQIDSNWSDEMIEGFYKIGSKFEQFCAEVFVVCKLKK